MDDPIDRHSARIAGLIETVQSSQPIDYAKQSRLDALEAAYASDYYTRQGVEENERADQEQRSRQADADGQQLAR